MSEEVETAFADPKPKPPLIIELNGGASPEHRISFLTTLLNNAEVKVNHFDSLRQRNLVMALAIFAGLSGFIFTATNPFQAFFSSTALTALMVLFTVLDHRLDRYNKGWQGTRWKIVKALRKVVNDPDQTVSFPRYDVGGERHAKLTGLKSMTHILLIVGAVLTYGARFLGTRVGEAP